MLIVLTRYISHRVHRVPHPSTRTAYTYPGFGNDPSPSTGHTTLVTPSSGRLKKPSKAGGVGEIQSPIVLRPGSEEMVTVTYEEGLAKLGLDRPPVHHMVESDPPGFMASNGPVFEEIEVSPRRRGGRTGRRAIMEAGRGRESSNWLPSYYAPDPRRRDVVREESDLGYRWEGGQAEVPVFRQQIWERDRYPSHS